MGAQAWFGLGMMAAALIVGLLMIVDRWVLGRCPECGREVSDDPSH